MGKVALLFSGQGAQCPGMGKDLYENNAASREVFDRLATRRDDIKELCFSSTKEELTVTSNTQPALFAVELAAAAALTAAGVKVDAVAGFSLGEISALAYSHVMPLEEAFDLVMERGRLMQEASASVHSAMTAVLKLSNEQVETIAAHHSQVYPVNYNCPGQVVVSGLAESLPAFEAEVKEAGGRCMRLAVAGAFHSPFMEGAAARFKEELGRHSFAKPTVPLYSNVTGELYGEDMLPLLSRQMSSPVRWETTVRNMLSSGIDVFIESGPGSTLSGLVKKTCPEAKTLSIATCEALEETLKALQEN